MTALTRSKATTCSDTTPINDETDSFVPSVSEDEAKTRFSASVAEGIDFLMRRGMGRDRASRELLNMIADGCSPDEEEVSYSYVCLLCLQLLFSCWDGK